MTSSLVTVIGRVGDGRGLTWVAPFRLLYCVTTESEAGNDEVELKGELWSATTTGDVELRRETSYAAEPQVGVPGYGRLHRGRY